MMPKEITAFADGLSGYALCARQTLHLTAGLTKELIEEGISGDYVECGVYQGAQAAIMAKVLDHYDVPGLVHLFDSFEGIPEAGPEDALQPGVGEKADGACGRLVSSGISVCSLMQVMENMQRWGVDPVRLRYYKGWFQDTLPGLIIKPDIAFLRIDGDLYESTKVVLEHLAPAVVPGGVILCDDYGDKCIGAYKAFDEYLEELGGSRALNTMDGATNNAWIYV